MALVVPRHKAITGQSDGVQTWLAEGLGITKQALTGFKDRGRFPTKYLRKISEFAGVPMSAMQPILTEEVLSVSRKWRMSVRDTELGLICIGLDNLNRRQHG